MSGLQLKADGHERRAHDNARFSWQVQSGRGHVRISGQHNHTKNAQRKAAASGDARERTQRPCVSVCFGRRKQTLEEIAPTLHRDEITATARVLGDSA